MKVRFAPATAAAAALAIAACASAPPLGGEAWVGVDAVLSARDLEGHSGHSARLNLDAARLRAAGLSEADVTAGRVLRVSCSPSVDATWSSFAIAPPGLVLQRGQVIRLRMAEGSTNDRLGLNRMSGREVAAWPDRRPAYRAIPDARERGLSRNYEQIELPEDLRRRYRIVQGSYVVAC